MNSMINKVQLIGNLGADPELKVFKSGKILCRISIAVNDYYKNGAGKPLKKTSWMAVTAWGDLAEKMISQLHKGARVAINGRLIKRKSAEKNGKQIMRTEIQAVTFTALNSGDKTDDLPF